MPEYLNVRGHDLYCYEWDNEGESVVLLHGGLSKTSSWDYLLVPALEDDFHVYAYDQNWTRLYRRSHQGVCTLNFKLKRQLHILRQLLKSQLI